MILFVCFIVNKNGFIILVVECVEVVVDVVFDYLVFFDVGVVIEGVG